MLAGSCGKPSTQDWFQADVVARADGIVLIWRRDLNERRGRFWMDHGPESTNVQSDFYAFETTVRAGGAISTRELEMEHRWVLGDNDWKQFPAYLLADGKVLVHRCHRLADIVAIGPTGVRCEQRTYPVYRQIGTRAERLYRTGNSLIFAAGLDGHSRPCAVSLEPLGTDLNKPFGRVRHYSGGEVERDISGRFAVAYLAPRVAYVVDQAGEMPIYRANCDGLRKIGSLLESPALEAQASEQEFREFVEVLDIVPTENPDDPALLLSWRKIDNGVAGKAYGILGPKGRLQRLPTRVEEQLGFDGGICMCTAFFGGTAHRILLDVSAKVEKGVADVRFEVFDLDEARTEVIRTTYPLK